MPSYYAIRQRSTGYYLPLQKSGQKGGTWVEPQKDGLPKLFRRKSDASGFLTVWLKGAQWCLIRWDSEDVEYDIKPMPHRKRDDMEVIEICLVPK